MGACVIGADFYYLPLFILQDFRQLVNNCKLYNPMPDDPVRVSCLKMSEVFEQQWIASGLCAEASRSKRATAGIAAPKFEPEEYDGMQAPKRSGDRRVSPGLSCLGQLSMPLSAAGAESRQSCRCMCI